MTNKEIIIELVYIHGLIMQHESNPDYWDGLERTKKKLDNLIQFFKDCGEP